MLSTLEDLSLKPAGGPLLFPGCPCRSSPGASMWKTVIFIGPLKQLRLLAVATLLWKQQPYQGGSLALKYCIQALCTPTLHSQGYQSLKGALRTRRAFCLVLEKRPWTPP